MSGSGYEPQLEVGKLKNFIAWNRNGTCADHVPRNPLE